MYKLAGLIVMVFFFSCTKNSLKKSECDIQKAYQENAAKVTITSGVWGTVSFTQGNCMPVVQPGITGCFTCPVQRTVRIYEYTKVSQANTIDHSSGFYEGFLTQLIKEVQADANGFYQVNIPQGLYTLVVIENGKLYANSFDGEGGINPVNFEEGVEKKNIDINYKAVY